MTSIDFASDISLVDEYLKIIDFIIIKDKNNAKDALDKLLKALPGISQNKKFQDIFIRFQSNLYLKKLKLSNVVQFFINLMEISDDRK